jgi:hypothetical protein
MIELVFRIFMLVSCVALLNPGDRDFIPELPGFENVPAFPDVEHPSDRQSGGDARRHEEFFYPGAMSDEDKKWRVNRDCSDDARTIRSGHQRRPGVKQRVEENGGRKNKAEKEKDNNAIRECPCDQSRENRRCDPGRMDRVVFTLRVRA